jgi:hypothetical protein
VWLVAIGIVILVVLLKPKIISEVQGKISPSSSLPPIVPVSSKPPEGSMREIAQIQKDKPTQDNFLENPALRMMGSQVLTQVRNVIQTGEMQAPTDIGSALMTMFSGDIHQGGQIGQQVGLLAAPIVSSLVGEAGVSGVSTLSGEIIPFVGAAGEAAELGVTGTFSTLGLPLGFAGMVLGEMIQGAFEENSPFSKAQQQVISDRITIGESRNRLLHEKGFTDQQIVKWIADHPEENYWYMLSPWPYTGNPSSGTGMVADYRLEDLHLVISGVYTNDEKLWLDDFANKLFGPIVNAANPDWTVPVVTRTYADIEAFVGGWRNDYINLEQASISWRKASKGEATTEELAQFIPPGQQLKPATEDQTLYPGYGEPIFT